MIPDNRRHVYYPLAAALTFYRTRAGLNMTALGKAVGLSRHALQRYEKAQQAPTPETLVALARFYDLPDTAFAELLDEGGSVGMEEALDPQEAQQIRWQTEAILTQKARKLPLPLLRKVLDYTCLLEMHCTQTDRPDGQKDVAR